MARRNWHLAAAALLILTSALFTACVVADESDAGAPRWEEAALTLPQGHRMSAYDSERDLIWLLTADFTKNSDAVLTRFEPGTGRHAEYVITGSTNWLGFANATAVDDDGRVWGAWGHRLVRFDPATEKLDEWAIPEVDAPDAVDPTEAGVAVDLALGPKGTVWIARNAADVISVLDPTSGSWETVPTAGVRGVFSSSLTVLPDGSAYFNGVLSESEWGLARIDAAAKEASRDPADALGYAVEPDGSLLYLDASTGEVRRLDETGNESESISATYSPPVDGDFVSGADGSVWFWHDSEGGKYLVRVSSDGEASLNSFPLIYLEGEFVPTGLFSQPPSEQNIVSDPRIEILLVDKRGDPWVITGHDGSGSGYAVMYRLDVDPGS